MRTHVEDAPKAYELFPMQGMDAGPACHMVRNVAVIEPKGPFGEERTVHALFDTIRELLEEGARTSPSTSRRCPSPTAIRLAPLRALITWFDRQEAGSSSLQLRRDSSEP